MVADLEWLQGQIINEPSRRLDQSQTWIEELTLEILSDEELEIAKSTSQNEIKNQVKVSQSSTEVSS